MDIKSLKLHLKDNHNDVIKILKHFKFHSIEEVNGNIMCGKPGGGSSTSVSVKLNEHLIASSFSIGFSGDLFGLISETHDIDFGEVLYICEMIINKKIIGNDEEAVFDGFLDDIYLEDNFEQLTYDDSILNEYEDCWNVRFAKDKISPNIQKQFNIMYCNENNRIIIPWYDEFDKLIGIMGRANYETDLRYFPIIPFSKSHNLYGLNKSKEHIQKTGRCYIGESEKFTMQLYTYKYYNATSIGCSSISIYQIELLLKYGCTEFVLCMDEGSKMETIKKNVQKIKECLFMRDDCKIGILLDKNNDIMIKDSKCSPSDLGKIKFDELVDKYIKWKDMC